MTEKSKAKEKGKSESKPKSETTNKGNIRPSKEVLEQLINDKGYRYAGEQYGVSDNTARRWAMAYGIPLKEKCVLKARERQKYENIGGKFIYEKELKARKKHQVDGDIKSKSVKPVKVKTKVQVQSPAPVVVQEVKHEKIAEPVVAVRTAVIGSSKNRYSSAELDEFRQLVEEKIRDGFEAICQLKESLSRVADNGTDDTASSGNIFEDGTNTVERENMTSLVAKKQKHLNALNGALVRIGNGTYGICMITGCLIPKERLLAVPHATKCVQAKRDDDNGKVVTPVEETVYDEKD